MIRKLHHSAYRCRDSQETRAFYEDFLGLRLAGTIEISETKTGRKTSALHSFYEMGDGAYVAFFEDPETPFAFKPQRDFDLYLALEVAPSELQPMLDKGRAAGIETRGISDHRAIHSIYSRDPDGYVVALAAKMPEHAEAIDPAHTRRATSSIAGSPARQGHETG